MSLMNADLQTVLPEIVLLTAACVILVVDVFLDDRRRAWTYALSQITLLGLVGLLVAGYSSEVRTAFSGAYVRDPMSDLLKIASALATVGVFAYARDYLRDRGLLKGEFFVLGLMAQLGTMVIISAHSFLIAYLGLELLSLSLYALVAFDRDSGLASESAMKYFVLGAIASGLLLYGISMIYGVTGSVDFAEVSRALTDGNAGPRIVLVFGLVFIVVGVAFKLGAVPFHMWVPDVYHGAPTAVAALVGSAPKIAAVALALRILGDGLQSLHEDWSGMLVVLSVLSLAIGNLVAIAQTNIKRMLAYSTISHVGFIVLGILSGNEDGYSAAVFYAIVYAFMALGAFGIVIALSKAGFEAESLDDYRGLNERSPWLAFLMLLIMFSMAGVPPTVGFYAKLVVLEVVVDVGLVWLAIVAGVTRCNRRGCGKGGVEDHGRDRRHPY